MIRPDIVIAGTPLQFRFGVAHCLTFRGLHMRVFHNDSKRLNNSFGYSIADSDGKVIKFCRACSAWAVAQAVMEN